MIPIARNLHFIIGEAIAVKVLDCQTGEYIIEVKFWLEHLPVNENEISNACDFAKQLTSMKEETPVKFEHVVSALWSIFPPIPGSSSSLIEFYRPSIDAMHEIIKAHYQKHSADYQGRRRELVEKMIERGQRYICAECGRIGKLTVDHKTPLRWGGTNDLDNLQFLCRECNSAKGARLQRQEGRA